MSIATIQTAQIIPEPAESYHRRSEISRGMLWDFFESPRLYEGRYVLKTIPPKEPTPAMKKGSLAHAALLEPETVAARYAAMPRYELDPENCTKSGDRSKSTATKYYEAKKEAFELQHADKTITDLDSLDMVRGMAESLARECGPWLQVDGMVERTITWTHEGTGLPMRCRPDWMRFTKRNTVIGFDLKGTADPKPRFFRSRIEEGLWLQAAHYSEGMAAALGMEVDAFFFVAVEFDQPHRCCVYQLDPQSMREAREARERLLYDLALALGSNSWADPQEGKVTSVCVRDFAFKRGE